MNNRPAAFAPLLAALVCVLTLLLAYAGSYLWLGVRIHGQILSLTGNTVEITQVIYDHTWQVRLFGPAARLESLVTGRKVSLHRREEFISP